MSEKILAKNMKRFKNILRCVKEYIETNNITEKTLIFDLTFKMCEKAEKMHITEDMYELENEESFSMLAYLSFVQTYFASKIKESHYKDSAAVEIYWDALSLKDVFRYTL